MCIFEIEIASIFLCLQFGFVYILAFVLCVVWLVVFRIITRTDGQSCQALIRAYASDSLCFRTAHALLAYVRTDKQNYNVDKMTFSIFNHLYC